MSRIKNTLPDVGSAILGLTNHILSKAKPYKTFRPLDYAKEYWENNPPKATTNSKSDIAFSPNNIDKALIFMQDKGYIKSNETSNATIGYYTLTKLGMEAKRRGGHIEYTNYINKKEKLIFSNNTLLKWTALATIASAIISAIALWRSCS